jgi:hypothetical protein
VYDDVSSPSTDDDARRSPPAHDGEEATRHLVDVGNIVPEPGVYRFPTARPYTS